MSRIPFQRLHHYAIPTHTIPKTRGDLAKKIWIVIKKHEDIKEHQQLLQRILTAVDKVLDEDCSILLLEKNAISLPKIASLSQPTFVLCFGVRSIEVGLNIKDVLYRDIKVNQTVFLFVDHLATIASDQAAKKHLWAALQKLFKKM